MPHQFQLRIVAAPRADDVGQVFVMAPGTWRVVGRAATAGEATVQLTRTGERALDADRQQLVNRTVGATHRVRASQANRRAPDVDLQDDGVSRTHAMVFVDPEGAASVVDLMSTNGTMVNGRDVQDADLQVGDAVVVGGTSLKLETA